LGEGFFAQLDQSPRPVRLGHPWPGPASQPPPITATAGRAGPSATAGSRAAGS